MTVELVLRRIQRLSAIIMALLLISNIAFAQEADTAGAIIYVSGASGDGEFKTGTVSWTQLATADTQAAQATLRFSKPDSTLAVTFLKNTDRSIPAAHFIVLQLLAVTGERPAALESVVSKAAAEAPGERLNGVAMPTTNGDFWFALSDGQGPAGNNARLLTEGAWIEIVAVSKDGIRAQIIFEKGDAGAKAISEIFQAAAAPASAEPPEQNGKILGCFKDPNNPFDLDGFLARSPDNTPQRCVETCRSKGFAYAGVQFSESCLCGNLYGQFGAADNCDMACTGDSSQMCGGYNANSVYATGK